MKLKTVVIYGSARAERQGIKAARFVIGKLEARSHDVQFADSQEYPLPLLDRMYKEFDEGEAPAPMEALATMLRAADGFVIVSGEYNHSVPPALKNLLDHFQSEYLYKPCALLTYSAGPFAGVRNLANLRAITAELGMPSIPSSFPVSAVHKAFDDQGNAIDSAYDRRIGQFLDEYEWYAKALKRSRDQQSSG